MNNIIKLIKSNQTVFSIQELEKIFDIPTKKGLESFLYRSKKNKSLENPYHGIRALPNYENLELACKIKPNSYISCERVLFQEGVFFQFYGNTYSCVSNESCKYKIGDKDFLYYKIKSDILNNPIGIRNYDNYRIATAERALCDYIYLNPNGKIDAPESINQVRLKQILPIYPKKTALYIKKLLNVG
ncbi:MAG TPA: hypothetical protein P5060_00260 [Candidatus Absconditabacterales bacterium]|nr:hypothetical protein [Candidatus Absconditabacterales bacterium]